MHLVFFTGGLIVKKSIGILGGMGPLATADLFTKIVNMTKADCDNAHIRIYIDSNSSIPDRTRAILQGGNSPIPNMTDSLKKLELCGADCIIMPCNTAHYFLPELQKQTSIPFISMLEATALSCKEKFPGKTAAILATKGTLLSGLYSDVLEKHDVSYIIPNDDEKDALMRVIYDGIKANAEPEKYKADLFNVVNQMIKRGADYFILGCTELPLAAQLTNLDAPTIDPTAELAKAAIKYCGYDIK